MFPVIEFLGKQIPLYSMFALVGILVMLLFVYLSAKKNKLNEYKITVALIIAFVGVFIGSHILYGIVNSDKLIKIMQNLDRIQSFDDFVTVFSLIFGGSVFYGGLIGGMITGGIYLKRATKDDALKYVDIMACSVPLFHCFGRLGCFFGGCCYGIECSFGVTYNHSLIESANGVTRFPVQLLESVLNLLLFFALCYLYKKKKKFDGYILPIYLITYAVMRFGLEFLRGDNELRGSFLIFSTSQFIAILMIPASVIMLILFSRRAKKTSQVKTEETDAIA